MNVYNNLVQRFFPDTANADPSGALTQRWAELSPDDARSLLKDSDVLQLLRAMRGDASIMSGHNYTELATYLMGSGDLLPYSLFRMPVEGIAIHDKSKALLQSLLRSGWTETSEKTQHKLNTLLGLMERFEEVRAQRSQSEPSSEKKIGIEKEEPANKGDESQFASDFFKHLQNLEKRLGQQRSETDEKFSKLQTLAKEIEPDEDWDIQFKKKEEPSSGGGSSTDVAGEPPSDPEPGVVPKAPSEVPNPEANKVLERQKPVSVSEALKNPELTSEQVLRLLTQTDDETRPHLRVRTGNAEELARKRDAFRAYVARLKEHAPRLTASQLQSLHQYLHLSQTVKGMFWDSNSPGYNQLMEDRALYHEYRALKTLLKNAQLPGSSDGDVVYAQISAEVRTVAGQLEDSALDDARRHALLVSANGEKPPLLQRLLELPISSAFSIEYKRSAFRKYLALLAHHTPRLSPEQGKRLYRALLDSQKVPVGLLGTTNSEGYRQVMQDKAVYQEYTMLKTCLKNGARMQDTPTGQRFLVDMQRFQDGPTWFTE